MYCVRVLAGADVGEGILIIGTDVGVAGMVAEVNVSVGKAVLVAMAVLVGSKVADGIGESVGAEGWKGVAVEVEFGLTVTRLKSGI